ncbi:MAG TPA: GIY-YIG nuclease family protein [Verrucomicrobiae bacterium]|nr:GIY-YIG nuclease family protein [Verrucomicrobiae bacterium]
MRFYYVYILQSVKCPGRFYAGFTENFRKRLAEHNDGKSVHTRDLRSWRVKTRIALTDCKAALDFERYLKTA